ncbi:MAG: CsbD family protein [Planococcus donghaensis]
MSDNNGFSDKLKGAVNKGKGEIKDQVGNATNDTDKQAEGKMDKAKGNVQDKIGDFKNNNEK